MAMPLSYSPISSSIDSVRKRIVDAFEKARQQPVDASSQHQSQAVALNSLRTKPTYYTEADGRQFHQHANALISSAVQSPHVRLRPHRENSYYVGDIDKQPSVEDLIAEILGTDSKQQKP